VNDDTFALLSTGRAGRRTLQSSEGPRKTSAMVSTPPVLRTIVKPRAPRVVSPGLSASALARRLGVRLADVLHQEQRGTFARGADGLFNEADVCAAWPRDERERAPRDPRPALERQLADTRDRATRIRAELERSQAASIERTLIDAIVRRDIDHVLRTVRDIPARYARAFAAELGVDIATGTLILQRVVKAAIAELDGLNAEEAWQRPRHLTNWSQHVPTLPTP
jgi:hypothetical protein